MVEDIQKSIVIFEALRKYRYKITIENGTEIILWFGREHYHHLAGFQHLKDMPDISNPVSKQKFYNDLRSGKIPSERIKKSIHYADIHERIASFEIIKDMLSSGARKIIVEFDNRKTGSEIKAKFHLYHREGIPFKGDAVFFTLFINAEDRNVYHPVTYVVEHSNIYIRGQNIYTCSIEKLAKASKKPLVGV